jgi:hypothetical protein
MHKRDEEEREAERRTAALMGFAVILMLAIAGVILVREIRRTTGIEDCLMAGRHNCTPIELPEHHSLRAQPGLLRSRPG